MLRGQSVSSKTYICAITSTSCDTLRRFYFAAPILPSFLALFLAFFPWPLTTAFFTPSSFAVSSKASYAMLAPFRITTPSVLLTPRIAPFLCAISSEAHSNLRSSSFTADIPCINLSWVYSSSALLSRSCIIVLICSTASLFLEWTYIMFSPSLSVTSFTSNLSAVCSGFLDLDSGDGGDDVGLSFLAAVRGLRCLFLFFWAAARFWFCEGLRLGLFARAFLCLAISLARCFDSFSFFSARIWRVVSSASR